MTCSSFTITLYLSTRIQVAYSKPSFIASIFGETLLLRISGTRCQCLQLLYLFALFPIILRSGYKESDARLEG